MIYLLLGGGLVGLLVWLGQKKQAGFLANRMQRYVAGTVATVAAIIVGIRGDWVVSVGLVALAAWLTASLRRPSESPLPSTDMSEVQARSLLGVDSDADREAIEAAYHRLIRRVHPDAGGAAGLAAMLNAARDQLLK